jgi:hypothetical protein
MTEKSGDERDLIKIRLLYSTAQFNRPVSGNRVVMELPNVPEILGISKPSLNHQLQGSFICTETIKVSA